MPSFISPRQRKVEAVLSLGFAVAEVGLTRVGMALTVVPVSTILRRMATVSATA
jgi:hypothetical protein